MDLSPDEIRDESPLGPNISDDSQSSGGTEQGATSASGRGSIDLLELRHFENEELKNPEETDENEPVKSSSDDRIPEGRRLEQQQIEDSRTGSDANENEDEQAALHRELQLLEAEGHGLSIELKTTRRPGLALLSVSPLEGDDEISRDVNLNEQRTEPEENSNIFPSDPNLSPIRATVQYEASVPAVGEYCSRCICSCNRPFCQSGSANRFDPTLDTTRNTLEPECEEYTYDDNRIMLTSGQLLEIKLGIVKQDLCSAIEITQEHFNLLEQAVMKSRAQQEFGPGQVGDEPSIASTSGIQRETTLGAMGIDPSRHSENQPQKRSIDEEDTVTEFTSPVKTRRGRQRHATEILKYNELPGCCDQDLEENIVVTAEGDEDYLPKLFDDYRQSLAEQFDRKAEETASDMKVMDPHSRISWANETPGIHSRYPEVNANIDQQLLVTDQEIELLVTPESDEMEESSENQPSNERVESDELQFQMDSENPSKESSPKGDLID